ITSLASTNGPSITLSLLSDIFTRAPVATGIRPPLSIMRPALTSRSLILLIASIRPGFGIIWPLGEVTMYMKRMDYGLPLRRVAAGLAAEQSRSSGTTFEPAAGRQREPKKIVFQVSGGGQARRGGPNGGTVQ